MYTYVVKCRTTAEEMVRRRRTPYLSPDFLRRYYGWGDDDEDEDEPEEEEEEEEDDNDDNEEEEEDDMEPIYDEEGTDGDPYHTRWILIALRPTRAKWKVFREEEEKKDLSDLLN